jgi:uncharacterized protein YndB with AHSA1/START domain
MSKEMFIKKVVAINAPVHKVWQVLTEPAYIKQYMHNCNVDTNWEVNTPIIFSTSEKVLSKGEILQVDNEKMLKYTTFAPGSGIKDKSGNYLTVTYELFSGYGNATLTVIQGDFCKVNNSEKRHKDASDDWDFILAKVKELAENMS